MPKNKHNDSDTSDSGPDDRNVAPTSKKAKPAAATGGDNKDPEWALGQKKIAKVRSFKGKASVDIREYYDKDGQTLPGKKGISLNPAQWRKLLEHVDDINEALANI